MPILGGQRQLAKLLALAERYHHHVGQQAEVAATIQDLLALAATVDRQPLLLAHLVSLAISALPARAVELRAPSLDAYTGPERPAFDRTAVSQATVAKLIEALLEGETTQAALVRAIQGERMFVLDTVRCCADGRLSTLSPFAAMPSGRPSLGDRIGAWLSRPVIELEGAQLMRRATRGVEAAKAPTFPAADAKLPEEPRGPAGPIDWLVRPVSAALALSLDRAVVLHFRSLAERRMAAVALAIRLYEIDHGHRPEQLTELVPEYLPTVPLDPFGDQGRVLGYRPDADPPVLYSTGPDGVDDSGAFTFRPKGGIDWGKLDQPFFLNGVRPRTRDDIPTEQASSKGGFDQQEQKQRDDANREEDDSRQAQPEEREEGP